MKNNYLPVILIATAFGLLAGGTGALLAGIYGTGDVSNLALNRELNLSSYGYAIPNLVIRDAKKVVVNQDVKTDETIVSLRSSLLSVFPKNSHVDAYYDLTSPFAQALAATTDGWVMAAWPKAQTKTEVDEIKSDYVVIDSSRKLYEIDQVLVAPDKTGGFVFMHLKGASSLNVRRLAPDEEIKAGQSLLISGADNSFALTALSAKSQRAVVLSSDAYPQELKLASGDSSRPSFIFNLSGEIIGAIDWQGKWLASPEIDAYWRSLLKSRSLVWPLFGVNYLDLAAVAGDNQLTEKGAKLQSRAEVPAVLKNSPADKAGLKSGDIITRVNGVEINVDNDLAAVLTAYNPGDSVSVAYLRDGKSLETDVILGTLK